MDYVKLGNSGLDVSRICLGTMCFGKPESGFHEWVIEEEESHKVIKQALDLGINFFDTANVYSYGDSEKILGSGIKKYAKRDEVVIATKVYSEMRKGLDRSRGYGVRYPTSIKDIATHIKAKENLTQADISLPILKELLEFELAKKSNSIEALDKLAIQNDFLLKDYALFNKALILANDGKNQEAKDVLAKISQSSETIELVKLLNHYLLTK